MVPSSPVTVRRRNAAWPLAGISAQPFALGDRHAGANEQVERRVAAGGYLRASLGL
jgi:hypothetical protein